MWNRLSSATATNGNWGESYTYNNFGNLTGKTPTVGSAPGMSVPANLATNQPTGMGSYDANGNPTPTVQTIPPSSGYIWDVENRLITNLTNNVDQPTSYSYDPWGRRIWKELPGIQGSAITGEIYFYGVMGQKLETYTFSYGNSFSASLEGINVYFGKKLLQSKGAWVVTDKLGTVRANTSLGAMNYFPYGEERTSSTNGVEKFGTYTRDGVGQDYAEQRYYNASMGAFWSPDPGGIRTANPRNPSSWNRYTYVSGDPVNKGDPRGYCSPEDDPPCFGTTVTAEAPPDPLSIGGGSSGTQAPESGLPGGDPGSAGGGGSSNPCAFGSLTGAQQSLLGGLAWGSESASAQQMFVTISADAAALGLNLAADGFSVSSIQVAAPGGPSETELNLSGGSITDLVNQMGSDFTSQTQNGLIGAPHSGYTGNYRQNYLTWSMQVNTGTDANGVSIVQIDIDPYNPARIPPIGLLGHSILQWIPNHITGGDTNYFKAASALQKRGINMGSPCTGGN